MPITTSAKRRKKRAPRTSSNRSSISLAAFPLTCMGQVTQMPISPGSIVLALGLSEASVLGTFHLPLLPFCEHGQPSPSRQIEARLYPGHHVKALHSVSD